MEIWDAYDRQGAKTGTELIRGEEIGEGLYHLVCEVVVRHADGDYLLLRRDPWKEPYPGFEEIGAGGSALKGESPLQGARRELLEESGIEAGELREIYRTVSEESHAIHHGFLCVTDIPKDAVSLQEGETVDYRWIGKEELIAFLKSDRCIPHQRDRLREYMDSLGSV
ncbi:MAG: NUDIX domain-containing protein [Lachnospiraceae bacterium]|nr:NUDIX domain-containing protein [Lachnospiraceae bacterium]